MNNQLLTQSDMLGGTAVRRHRRRSLLVACALSLVTLATIVFAPSARAATLYVDAAAASAAPGTGCGAAAAYTQICAAPGPGTGTPCAAGSALAAANPGDTIQVCAGTYNENVEISTSNVTLLGAMAGIPAGPDAAPAGRGIGESVIVGQTTSAIHLAVGGIIGSVIDGFTIQSGNRPAIHDNTNGLSGSHVWANNIIEGSPTCSPALINLNRINGSQILNNNLRGCQWAISVQSGNGTDAPSLIQGNYIVDNSPSAGAIIMSANNAAGHTISGNLIEGTGSGMILGCADLQITDNTVRNRGTAIFLHTNATGATITGNDLINDSNGVRQSVIFGPYNLGTLNEVHYNNIEGSAFFGARNEVTPGDQDINATCNWWGSADGPFPTGSGDEVTAGVEFTPWLVAPAPGGACTGGLPCTNDVDCADGLVCNGTETCDIGTGTCNPGTPVACDDGNACTADSCVEPTGTCSSVAEPDGTSCDDDNTCTDSDSCTAGVCGGAPVPGCVGPYLGFWIKAPGKDANRQDIAGNVLPKNFVITLNDVNIDDGDSDDPENFVLKRVRSLLNAAATDGGGAPATPDLHYIRYQIRRGREGVAPAGANGRYPLPARHLERVWQLDNQFGTLNVRSLRTDAVLVPAAASDSASPPDPGDASHFTCYRVTATRDVTDQTPDRGNGSGSFRRDLQLFVSDDFFDDCTLSRNGVTPNFSGTPVEGSCLFDLLRPVELCNPADKTAVEGDRVTSAVIDESTANATQSLLCYKARRAGRLGDTGAAAQISGSVGDRIDPPQARHTKRRVRFGTEVFTTPGNQFPAPVRVDTQGDWAACIPTTVTGVAVAP